MDDQAKVPYFLCSVDNTFQAFSVYSTGDSREFERSSRPVAVLWCHCSMYIFIAATKSCHGLPLMSSLNEEHCLESWSLGYDFKSYSMYYHAA